MLVTWDWEKNPELLFSTWGRGTLKWSLVPRYEVFCCPCPFLRRALISEGWLQGWSSLFRPRQRPQSKCKSLATFCGALSDAISDDRFSPSFAAGRSRRCGWRRARITPESCTPSRWLTRRRSRGRRTRSRTRSRFSEGKQENKKERKGSFQTIARVFSLNKCPKVPQGSWGELGHIYLGFGFFVRKQEK